MAPSTLQNYQVGGSGLNKRVADSNDQRIVGRCKRVRDGVEAKHYELHLEAWQQIIHTTDAEALGQSTGTNFNICSLECAICRWDILKLFKHNILGKLETCCSTRIGSITTEVCSLNNDTESLQGTRLSNV